MITHFLTLTQVITRLDVGSESSGLGSEGGSEGSHSPPLGQNHSGESQIKHFSEVKYSVNGMQQCFRIDSVWPQRPPSP